jgi:carbamoyl-phosphate synthase/aspartate carbamoyltransferase
MGSDKPATPAAFEGSVPSAPIPVSQSAVSVAPANHSIVVHDVTPPGSPQLQAQADIHSPPTAGTSPRPIIARAPASFTASSQNKPALSGLYPPATGRGIDANPDGLKEGEEVKWDESMAESDAVLELADGLALAGHSFGAKKSIAGECVFQTGQF